MEDYHKQFVKYFDTVAELHKLGYEKFRVCAYISPNGAGYRCWLTVKQNSARVFASYCISIYFLLNGRKVIARIL
jgi:hypothetical protein